MEYIHHYKSPLGKMTGTSDGKYLTGLWFEGQKYSTETLAADHEERSLPIFEETDRWLYIYFSGKVPDFMPSICVTAGEFRKAVWEILRRIPYGETITYGEIADQIAKKKGLPRISAQAVGGAVGHNPIALIIPCHRVIGAKGRLTGYTAGIDKKRWLLNMEKMHSDKNM